MATTSLRTIRGSTHAVRATSRQMQQQAGAEIIRKTGGPASFNHGPKILWWKHERGETFERIAAFVQPGSYAAMRLCGMDASQAFIDKSYLHFSGFADNPRGRWDERLCRMFDVPMTKLPRIVESHAVIGQVAREHGETLRTDGRYPGDRGVRRHGRLVPGVVARRAPVCVSMWPARRRYLPPRRASSRRTSSTARSVGDNRPLPACGIRMPTSTAAA